MKKSLINEIKSIKIEKIWGYYDFYWELDNHINILIGENGSGKSTIINLLYALLSFNTTLLNKYEYQNILVTTNLGNLSFNKKEKQIKLNGSKIEDTVINEDISCQMAFVSTFDKPIEPKRKPSSPIKILAKKVTHLDTELLDLIQLFVEYQLDIYINNPSNIYYKIEQLSEEEKLQRKKTLDLFFEQINIVFKNKYDVFIAQNYTLSFIHKYTQQKIDFTNLSSGEKQLLILFLKALLTKNTPHILLLDEPEISLHINVQVNLINYLLALNNQSQLIIVTHSPSIVQKGYMDAYKEIETLKTYSYAK